MFDSFRSVSSNILTISHWTTGKASIAGRLSGQCPTLNPVACAHAILEVSKRVNDIHVSHPAASAAQFAGSY